MDEHNDLCIELVTRLMKHKYAWPFNQPVDPIALGIPDYLYVVRRPMDLGTILRKLQQNAYATRGVTGVLEDIALVWYNCMLYNPPGSDVALMGLAMEAETKNLVTELGLGVSDGASTD